MTRPPDDRDMDQLVRSWLRADEGHPGDRNRQIGRIMGRADETRQRRGPWRFLPFWRHGTATDSHDDDLVPARRGGVTPLAGAAVAVLAFVVLSFAVGMLERDEPMLGPAASPTASPSPSPVPLQMTADDAALFERLSAGTWLGPASDVDEALALYDDDAVHTALWLDEGERFVGSADIAYRMLGSARVDATDNVRIRLPDHQLGARRYFTYSPGLGAISCVFWIENDQFTRHDCILPMYLRSTPPHAPWSFAMEDLQPPSPEDIAARQVLSSSLLEAMAQGDVLRLAEIVSPDVVHLVQSDNQAYTLTNFAEWTQILSSSPIEAITIADLHAPEGELRWADFSSVGGGTLCVFWAREGQVARHDCVVPGYTPEFLSYLGDDPESSPTP